MTSRDSVRDHMLMVHLLGDIREAAGGRDLVLVVVGKVCAICGGEWEINQLLSPKALRGRLLISSTCATCSSDKHEAEVCFNQHSYSFSMMVRP